MASREAACLKASSAAKSSNIIKYPFDNLLLKQIDYHSIWEGLWIIFTYFSDFACLALINIIQHSINVCRVVIIYDSTRCFRFLRENMVRGEMQHVSTGRRPWTQVSATDKAVRDGRTAGLPGQNNQRQRPRQKDSGAERTTRAKTQRVTRPSLLPFSYCPQYSSPFLVQIPLPKITSFLPSSFCGS